MSAPTLVVGLGGFGCRVVAEAKQLLEREVVDDVGAVFLALDQDDPPAEVRKALGLGEFWRIPTGRVTDILSHLDARGDGPSWRALLPWLPTGDGLDLVDALEPGGARQYRTLGRLGYFVAAKEIDRQLEMALDRLRLSENRLSCVQELRVMLVTSVAGGTGSGMLLDVAHRLRRIEPRAVLLLHLALPEIFVGFGDVERGKANAFATFSELLALRAKRLPFRPCQPCGNSAESVGRREMFSRILVHGRAASSEDQDFLPSARAIARAIAAQFEAAVQSSNRSAAAPFSRLMTSPMQDAALGHLLSHGGAASLEVPAFSLADDCVIDFLLSDLEKATKGAITNPPSPEPAVGSSANLAAEAAPTVLPSAVLAAARAWSASLERVRQQVENEHSLFIIFGKFREVDQLDPTRPSRRKATPRMGSSESSTTLDLERLADLPEFRSHLEALRQAQATATTQGIGATLSLVTPETSARFRHYIESLRKFWRFARCWRWQTKARLEFLRALFDNPSFVQELGIALRDALASESKPSDAVAEGGPSSHSHPPPPEAVQDWLVGVLKRERPGLVEWYRSLAPEKLTRMERRERLRAWLAGGEIEVGLANDAPLDGQELSEKLRSLCSEAAATNPFIERTPSCRHAEIKTLLKPRRLEGLAEFDRTLEEFRNSQGRGVGIEKSDGSRIWLYSEDLLHPVEHLKRLDEYRHAYRNHGARRALLHIDARFLHTPDDLYQFTGSPDQSSESMPSREPKAEVQSPVVGPPPRKRPARREPRVAE